MLVVLERSNLVVGACSAQVVLIRTEAVELVDRIVLLLVNQKLPFVEEDLLLDILLLQGVVPALDFDLFYCFVQLVFCILKNLMFRDPLLFQLNNNPADSKTKEDYYDYENY